MYSSVRVGVGQKPQRQVFSQHRSINGRAIQCFFIFFSHCSQHRWKKTLYNPSKKSVFAVEEDDQEQDNSQDEAAGDDDDNVTDDVVSSIRDMKNQIEDDVASIAKGQTQSDGFNEVKVGAKSPMLSIISIQQNIPETDKLKLENKNLIDDGRVSVTGQALPIVSIRQNISKKTGKAKKGKAGKSSMYKSKDTAKETGKGTNTMATQTEKRVVTKAVRDKDNKPVRKCFDSEESGSALEVKKDAAVEAEAGKVNDEDQVDGIVTDGEADIGLPVGMSDLYLMEPEASSAAGLSVDMTNDALPLVDIKADTFTAALCPDDADIDKLDEGEVSQENITTKIAWVTLGTCPVCKTDLKSKTNKPCHTIDAMENESNDTILEEVGEEEPEPVRGMQRKICEASLSGKNLTGAEKAHESEGTAADFENCGNTEDVCDNINVTEMNVSNNALPKRTTDQTSTRQTGAAEFDSKLPCEGCHDVQPSDSDKSLQIQQRENIDNQSVGAISRNEDRSQSRSESSGAC